MLPFDEIRNTFPQNKNKEYGSGMGKTLPSFVGHLRSPYLIDVDVGF
jgi:hypothetical protein